MWQEDLLFRHRFHQFSVGGPPEAVWQGDWIAGKGIGLACVDTPEGKVQLYDTHTCANYGHSYRHMDLVGETLTYPLGLSRTPHFMRIM